MKRFLTKRWHGIPVGIVTAVLLVCVLAGSAFAAAAFTLPISGTVTVATGSSEITAYSDASCTTPLTSIDWGSMRRGTSASKEIYFKWTGDADYGVHVVVSHTDLVPALLYPDDIILTFGPPDTFDCNSLGEKYMVTATLSVGKYAPAGAFSFTINFDSDPIPPPP